MYISVRDTILINIEMPTQMRFTIETPIYIYNSTWMGMVSSKQNVFITIKMDIHNAHM